jgi:hypothetical protein
MNKIINWNLLTQHSEKFKNQQPFKFTFIENIISKDFYQKLYDTYPDLSEFDDGSDMSKSQLVKNWGKDHYAKCEPTLSGKDERFSSEWNEFKLYTETDEFIENFRKFTGAPINRLKQWKFMAYRNGGFQLPHVHNVGPSTVVIIFYFSKGWEKGDPGGTYIASDLDESDIIFEPYNLDNSMVIFQDSPKAIHGIRYITKDVERRAIQITLEEYNDETGWTGGNQVKF